MSKKLYGAKPAQAKGKLPAEMAAHSEWGVRRLAVASGNQRLGWEVERRRGCDPNKNDVEGTRILARWLGEVDVELYYRGLNCISRRI